jgi:hypothetical protein
VRIGLETLDERERIDFVALMAARQAQTNPQAAFDLASIGGGLTGDDYNYFLRRLASGWAEANPQAAFGWASQTSDPDLRAELQASALSIWAAKDPAATAALLAQIPAGSSRDQVLRHIGNSWGAHDTEAALAWVANLPNPTERQNALAAVRESAPVGIGLVLSGGGEGGYPTVNQTVEGSSSAELGVFAKGDQIAAISDATGQMVDVKGRPLGEVVGMIRGTPGTTVRIQFVSADGAGQSVSREVVIPRRQLLMKQP